MRYSEAISGLKFVKLLVVKGHRSKHVRHADAINTWGDTVGQGETSCNLFFAVINKVALLACLRCASSHKDSELSLVQNPIAIGVSITEHLSVLSHLLSLELLVLHLLEVGKTSCSLFLGAVSLPGVVAFDSISFDSCSHLCVKLGHPALFV